MGKRAYVYQYPDCRLTDNWHSGGGLLIVTSDDPEEVWKASPQYRELAGYRHEETEPERLGAPDHVLEVADDTADLLIVFPDAGCC